MKIATIALTVVGLLMTLMGVVWMGQGSGYFPYPETSFMVNQTPWIWRGAMLAIAGLALVWVSRRMGR